MDKAEELSRRGKASRRKGQTFERQIARELRELGYGDAKRGFQTRGGTAEAPDVQGVGHLLIECKARQKVNRRAAWQQAAGPAVEGQVPIAVCKDDRHEPVVVMDARDLPVVGAGFSCSIPHPLLIELSWEDFKRDVLPRLVPLTEGA